MKVEVSFLVFVSAFYGLVLAAISKYESQMGRFFHCICTIILLIKVFYYLWAIFGAILYFTDVKFQEETSIQNMSTTIFVLTIINIVDCIRLLMIIGLMVSIHVICKRRARNSLQNNTEDYLNLSTNPDVPNLFRDTENFYRHREINKGNGRLIKKQFKAVVPPGDKMCSICCDEMTVGTQLSCDGKHIYHKECIQMWLLKQRNCPLCKCQVI